MPPRYFLRCLGPPELRGPGGEPVRFRTRKHLALLVYLSVEPRQPHRRDRLADLLWPEASPSEGRHSLATALSVIRGRLGPRTFESSRDAVRFVAPELEVDLDRLARNDILGDELTPPLEVGGFLDDFEVSRAPEYMLWRELRRAHWFPAIRRAFVLLMDRCRRTGDFARIEPLADRLLALDELSEDAVRAKMEGRAFSGDRVSAIRIFQQWRQKLTEELGAAPSPLVEGMALRLRRRGYEPPGSSHIPTVATDQWRDRAFVGRGTQYRVVYERWEQTARQEGRHALVLGDSGIGKTTLVERLVTAAGLEGAVSSRVQCYEGEREIPYAAIGTLVRGLLERPGASATPPEWLAELARTIPAVAQRFPHLPPARDSEGETARLRLTEGVHQLASAVADENPLILVVDDVHLADDASVAVLHLLMRRTQEQRIMIALTAREGELARSPHAGRLMEVRRALALEPVELPPLTEEEMGQVVSALASPLGLSLPPAVRRALLRASAGIPMVAELLFDDWRTHGEQCLALAIGAMTVDARGGAGDDVFRQVLDRVIQGLSGAARAVLDLAAILGERLNDVTMYELVDLTLAQTLAGMSELTGLRILRDGGRELEFRNELLRGHAYLNVPSPVRRALHGLIADRLLAEEAAGKSVPGLMLAWHCYRAGRPESAAPYLLRGSREAIAQGSTFEVELALTSAMSGLPPVLVPEAKLLLCQSLQDQGRWADSLSLLMPLGTDDKKYLERKRVLELCARSYLVQGEEEARRYLLEIRATAEGLMDLSDQAHLLVPTQSLSYFIGDIAEADYDFHRAASIASRAVALTDRLDCQTAYTILAWQTRKAALFPEIVATNESLFRESLSDGYLGASLARLYHIQGCMLSALGRYTDALRIFSEALRLSQKHGNEHHESCMADNLSMCHGRLGEYPLQEVWAERALSLLSQGAHVWRKAKSTLRAAWSLGMRGEYARALAKIESAPKNWWESSRPWVMQACGLLRADVYWLCGEDRRALDIASETVAACGVQPLTNAYAGTVARWAARSGIAGINPDAVASALERLSEEIELHDAIDQVELTCARLWFERQRGGDWQEGPALLQQGLERLPSAVKEQLRRLHFIN
jgi:DNA-binding SARP family transcriptional activator/tetratricopeptide (TPR) repeat protein